MSHVESASSHNPSPDVGPSDPKTQTQIDLELIAEMIGVLLRVRVALQRWATRYAGSPHARKAVAETHKLIQEVDALYDRLPHHSKD
jgi:hypothetical protein